MADPRNNLLFKCQVAAQQQQSQARNFFNAAGKVGDLAILNSAGLGKISQGLRTLASVSNTIRSGCGALPTSIGSTLESGTNWVLDNVGIPPTMVQAVSQLNPAIANQAHGQAQQIFQKVKQGNFKITDIPGSLQDLQNLERLGRNIFTPSSTQGPSIKCTTSPYAIDLISKAPKHKFLFVVQFVLSPGYGELDSTDFAFVVKTSTRPNIKFAMEDVNYYNFRSKVITKTEFENMTMTFHDDITNNSMVFYNAYRNAISPISNMDDTTFYAAPDPTNGGMDFRVDTVLSGTNKIVNTIPTNHYSASRGPLVNDNVGVIREIKLFHVYDAGRKTNIFQFLNPRIESMTMDDVDMSIGNEGNEISLTFNYDTVYIETDVDVSSLEVTDNNDIFNGQSRSALYPLRYNGSAESMDAAHQKSIAQSPAPFQPSCNPLSSTNTQTNPIGDISGAINSTTTQGVGGTFDVSSSLGI